MLDDLLLKPIGHGCDEFGFDVFVAFLASPILVDDRGLQGI